MIAFDSGSLDSAAEVGALSLATVDVDVVTDYQNQENPEGDAPLGSNTGSESVDLPGGVTNGPDLLSVGNFRPSSLTRLHGC